jgi:hypothetical protein
MKNKLVLSILAVVLFACSKDKFETKPQIKIKSINGERIAFKSTLVATLEYTDKEGDLDSVFVVRQRLNRATGGPLIMPALPYPLPEFNNETSGDIVVSLAFDNALTLAMTAIRIPGSSPVQFQPDTIQLKFVVKDKAGNLSDTAVSDKIIVARQQ